MYFTARHIVLRNLAQMLSAQEKATNLMGMDFTLLVKKRLQIDDSLDVFAVHGVGGMMGSLLLAIFASQQFGGAGYAEGAGMASQLWIQLKAVGIVAVWSAVATLIIGYMVAMVIPMRVSEDEERDGLDLSSHGERAWDLD